MKGLLLRRVYDAKTQRELSILGIVLPLSGAIILAAAAGLYFWRLHSFDRSIATIEAIWQETLPRKGVVTMANLAFTRIDYSGKRVACLYHFEIGRPWDGFVVGDKVEIVPATGTCQRADIIGKADRHP